MRTCVVEKRWFCGSYTKPSSSIWQWGWFRGNMLTFWTDFRHNWSCWLAVLLQGCSYEQCGLNSTVSHPHMWSIPSWCRSVLLILYSQKSIQTVKQFVQVTTCWSAGSESLLMFHFFQTYWLGRQTCHHSICELPDIDTRLSRRSDWSWRTTVFCECQRRLDYIPKSFSVQLSERCCAAKCTQSLYPLVLQKVLEFHPGYYDRRTACATACLSEQVYILSHHILRKCFVSYLFVEPQNTTALCCLILREVECSCLSEQRRLERCVRRACAGRFLQIRPERQSFH